MAEDGLVDGWHAARLIPTVGIRGQEEQEKRATSSLLAVMRAVPEFGHALVGPLGAPKGRISTFAEVQLKDQAGKTHIPDGAIVVERGKTCWRCLVEVKTGTAELKDEQVNRYLDVARENRLMGENWVAVRNGAGDGTLRPSDAAVRDVADRWEQFVEYLCLGLGQDLGRDVRPVRLRKQTAAMRLDANCAALADSGVLEAAIRVPDAVGPLVVQADLRTRKVITSVALDAPGDGRPPTRVNWLLRQLKEAPAGLIIDASFTNTKASTASALSAAREDPKALLLENAPKRPPRAFRLALSRPMGTKRGKGERSFVLETRRQAIDFYRELVQNLRPWRASAPRLPEEDDDVSRTPHPQPPAFSSADAREATEGVLASAD